MASLACIKRGTVIEADKSIHSQLRLINFSDGSPYETLHAFISKSLAPYFKSYVKESGRADRDGDKMAPSVEKKLAELEMGLLHLQQNIDIPEITLIAHTLVNSVIRKCADENRKAKVADFGDKVEDSSFLNQLQNGVNRWIKEIKKVTKLDRDPSSGTALQVGFFESIHFYDGFIKYLFAFLGNFLLVKSGKSPLSHSGEARKSRSGTHLGHSKAWKTFSCHCVV